MTGRQPPAPWWASGGSDAGSLPDDDPLTAHRRARAGNVEDPTPDGSSDGSTDVPFDDTAADDTAAEDPAAEAPSWWGPAAEAVARLSEDLATTAIDNADRARGDRPWHGTDGANGHAAGRDPGPRPGPAAAPDAAAHLDVCGVCPICVGLRALGSHRPELVGHLAEAARHLAAAVRTLVDAPEPGTTTDRAEGRGTASADDGLTRIDLDDPADGGGASGATGWSVDPGGGASERR